MKSTYFFNLRTLLTPLFLLSIATQPLLAQFAGGDGSLENPYQISTVEQLQNMKDYLSDNFVLINDIDATGTENWNSGQGFEPVGDLNAPFEGTFNGKTFIISGLYINRPQSALVGLFGATEGATIEFAHLVDVNIKGSNYVGGLVGKHGAAQGESTLNYSFVTGTVYGLERTGGLVGALNHGNVNSCFSTAEVQGVNVIGGLIGEMDTSPIDQDSHVSYSYASGKITLIQSGYDVGGLIGFRNLSGRDFVIDSFWNTTVSGTGSSDGGAGLIESEMKQQSSFSGFDFNYTWQISEGDTYPYLKHLPRVKPGIEEFDGGVGTVGNPYQISTVEQLQSMIFYLDAHFVLISDIDASSTTEWGEGTELGFEPIGDIETPFEGTLNGQEYTITHLYSNRAASSYNGLFGVVSGSDAKVNNVTLYQIEIEGDGHTGGLAGRLYNGVSVLGVDVSGSVTGHGNHVGGLIGSNHGGTVSGSFSKASVTGEGSNTGGLVGINEKLSGSGGTIFRSYATGDVSGIRHSGGLVGRNYNGGNISESYASGNVEASESYSGGLLGSNHGGEVLNSYASGNVVSSSDRVGGLIGINEELSGSGGTIERSFSVGLVSGSSSRGGLVGYNDGTVSNSFWNTETSGQGNSSFEIGTGLTTTQMLDSTIYYGFDFENTWDIADGFGFPYLREVGEHRFNALQIEGNEGWRIFTTPIDSITFGELLDPLWTQGFTGADYEEGTPNVYVWDESTGSFTALENATDIVTPGVGFIVYVFDDQNLNGSPDGFPKTILLEGEGLSGDNNLSITYTEEGENSEAGWNLVGNPYGHPIMWGSDNGQTGSNISESFYVWNAAAGQYQSHNGLTGTLENAVIAPGQGFWVKAMGADPQLGFTSQTRTQGGILRKKAPLPQIKLTLTSGGQTSATVVMFNEDAAIGNDPLDAYKLSSLNATYLSLGTVEGEEGSLMDIQALPLSFEQELILDLKADHSGLGGESFLSWELEALLEDIHVEIHDLETGKVVDVFSDTEYSFAMAMDSSSKRKQVKLSKPAHGIITPTAVKAKQSVAHFRLRILKGTGVSVEQESGLPTDFALNQNYPNPFNPSTMISFQLPVSSEVTLQVFDLMGRKVATLVDGNVEAGHHQVPFNAGDLASGMYIYRLKAGANVFTKKLTLIK